MKKFDWHQKFYQNYYYQIPNFLSQMDIIHILSKLDTLKYQMIFKTTYSTELDPNRFQALITRELDAAFEPVFIKVKRHIEFVDIPWIDRKYVVLKSLPGGVEQEMHQDFLDFELNQAYERHRHLQGGLLIALCPNTTLQIIKNGKYKTINLDVGSVMIFRGDLGHAGSSYKTLNYRIHVALTIKDIPWNEDFVQRQPRPIGCCRYCGRHELGHNSNLQIRNHERRCSSRPDLIELRKLRSKNDKMVKIKKMEKNALNLNHILTNKTISLSLPQDRQSI
eukprot:NODE_579_length_5813_cov_0.453448.p3 type:complete len:279 gc:universal NODE_579_length_5813_cov_0.453448:1228-392(-)